MISYILSYIANLVYLQYNSIASYSALMVEQECMLAKSYTFKSIEMHIAKFAWPNRQPLFIYLIASYYSYILNLQSFFQ